MLRWSSHCHLLIRNFNKAVNYLPKFQTHLPKTNFTELQNGIKVVSENWHSEICTVGLWMDIGSRCESDRNNGVAHFMEHMYFKGTSKRDHLTIQNEVVKKGANLKSYMTREMISIYASCHKNDLEWAISLLGEIVSQPKFDNAIFEKEKHVILNEMQIIENNYREVVFDYLHATAYQGTPLGRSMIGTQENVEKMTTETLMDFVNKYYKAPRMALIAVGDIDHTNLNKLAETHLAQISCNYETGIDHKLPCRFTSSDIRDRDDALPMAHVAIGFHGPGGGHSDCVALWIASAIHGSYDKTYGGTVFTASKLAARSFSYPHIYSYENFFIPYYDTSLWGFYYTGDRGELQRTTEFILGETVRLSMNITEMEVNRAKNQLKTHILMGLNGGTESVCDEIGRQMNIYGRRISAAEMLQRIDMVSVDDVRETCMTYLYNKSPAMAGYGPIEGLPDLNVTASKTWWLRY